ncbi:MAG: L,D-transpeptidase family protein [Chitinophagales bacterium]|nr:L,D-transpeptidase family protein [Chitinophagales bacterium]
MNNKVLIVIGLIIAASLLVLGVFYGAGSGAAKRVFELLESSEHVLMKEDSEKITSRELLAKYYRVFGYAPVWSEKAPQPDRFRVMLTEMLNHADSLGLDRNDYHASFLNKYDSITAHLADKEAESELVFADAAVSFLFDVAYGKEIVTAYNGVKYSIDTARILNAYNSLLTGGNWRGVLDTLEPAIQQYTVLKQRLNSMKAMLRYFPEGDTLTIADTEGGKIAAAIKLRFYGIITDSLAADSNAGEQLKEALVLFQKMMSFETTGKLDKKTTAALNESLSHRIAQVKSSLNYWRWTGRLDEREFILVNIPAARLQIVNEDSATALSMKVIVGKPETKTPSFTAYMSKVIAYPYWTVPFSIATKEMLPKIRKNISYLDANNLQVLDNKGKPVDPSTVNWGALSTKYFPYTLRQSTGCDNALGVLKFDINSPFSIYLHDTNARQLFGRNNRFLSHGCIRVEKPFELAGYLLENGLDSATTSKLNQCLKDEKPTDFKLRKKFPVLILYMTADIDPDGSLKFYDDVYGREEKVAT